MFDRRTYSRHRRSTGEKSKLIGILLLLSLRAVAEPTPVADEALLIFLADMVEVDGELTDVLDMLEISNADVNEESVPAGQTTEIVTVEETAEQ